MTLKETFSAITNTKALVVQQLKAVSGHLVYSATDHPAATHGSAEIDSTNAMFVLAAANYLEQTETPALRDNLPEISAKAFLTFLEETSKNLKTILEDPYYIGRGTPDIKIKKAARMAVAVGYNLNEGHSAPPFSLES